MYTLLTLVGETIRYLLHVSIRDGILKNILVESSRGTEHMYRCELFFPTTSSVLLHSFLIPYRLLPSRFFLLCGKALPLRVARIPGRLPRCRPVTTCVACLLFSSREKGSAIAFLVLHRLELNCHAKIVLLVGRQFQICSYVCMCHSRRQTRHETERRHLDRRHFFSQISPLLTPNC